MTLDNPTLSRSAIALFLAACALALGGCADEADEPSSEHRVGVLPPPLIGIPISTNPLTTAELDTLNADVCDPAHMVGRRGTGVGCPDIGSWVGKRVFPGANTPAELAAYCYYNWPNGTPDATEISTLATRSVFLPENGGELAPDCRAVQPQSDAISEQIGGGLQSLFHWYAGRVGTTMFGDPGPLQPPASIATVVVDTIPQGGVTNPTSDHGLIVESVVEAFACPGADCTVDVQHQLGLPRTNQGINVVQGGVIGLQSDLARGIFFAVEDYLDLGQNAPEHLVINLSVGWEPSLFSGQDPTDATPAVDTVYDAIRYARCHGALVIAAAGNSNGLVCDEQALAPGRWEESLAPLQQSDCDAVGVSNGVFDSANYAPLVHSVGGLDGLEDPMPGTRENGMPRLAAPATHGVADLGAGPVEVRTGTSIASAVAAGAASLVWAHNPDLSPSQVMGALYSMGHDVGTETAGFGAYGGGSDVRRLDTCRALKLVCNLPGARCNDVNLPLACNTSSPTSVAALAEDIAALTDPAPNLPLDPSSFSCHQHCGAPAREVYRPPGHDPVCAESERDPTLRLTNPQPPKPACEDCLLDVSSSGDADAQLTLVSAYANETLLSASIEVLDRDTGVLHVFDITDPEQYEEETIYVVSRMEINEIASYSIPLLGFAGITNPVEPKLVLEWENLDRTEDAMILNLP